MKKRRYNFTLDGYERGLCVSLGHAFESAVRDYQYNLVDFAKKALSTDTFEDYLIDGTVFSQGSHYIAGTFETELKEKGIAIEKYTDENQDYIPYHTEAAFWLGYLFLAWKIGCDVSGEYILRYDIEEMVWGYETLHTQSIQYAIEFIEDEYLLV